MTSITEITLRGKDSVGCKHQIVVMDCPDNPDWFTLKVRMEGDSNDELLSLPKSFIPHLTKALEKINTK